MKKIFTLLFTITAFFSFRANAQTTDLIKYLPEKATMIMDIDGGSLSQKLSWKELMAMKMFDSLLKKAEPGTRMMIAEPSETGINFRDHLYLVIDFNEDDKENMGSHIAFYGKVMDEAKLSALVNKATIKEITKKTIGENKMFIGKDFVFGWNKSVFVLHSGTSLMKRTGMNVKQAQTKKEIASLEKKCIELLTPKAKNIYTSNKYFANLANEKADMRIWMETAKMNRMGKGKNPFAMFGMSSDYQAKYKTAIVNFENGKIVSKGYTYYNDELSASFQKMYSEKLNPGLIKKIPPGNLLGLFAMSFKPDAIKEFVEKTGMWQEFKKMDEKSEFDPGILFDNLKGDILIAVNMPDQPEEVSEEEGKKNPFASMQIYFAATVKDEKKVNQLIDSIKLIIEEKKKQRDSAVVVIEEKKERIEEERTKMDSLRKMRPPVITFPDSLVIDEEVRIEELSPPKKNNMFKDFKPVHKVENGVFIFSMSDKQLAKFGTSSTNVHDKLIGEYGNYPMLMTIDLKTILSIAMSAIKKDVSRSQEDLNGEEDAEMYSFFEVFDKWVIAGGKFENGGMQSIQEIKFSSPDENSLKQIMKMFDLIFSAVTKPKRIEVKEN